MELGSGMEDEQMGDGEEETQKMTLLEYIRKLRSCLDDLVPEGGAEEAPLHTFHPYNRTNLTRQRREVLRCTEDMREILRQFVAWCGVCPRPTVKEYLRGQRDKQDIEAQLERVGGQVGKCLAMAKAYAIESGSCDSCGTKRVLPPWVGLRCLSDRLAQAAKRLGMEMFPPEPSDEQQGHFQTTICSREFVMDIVCLASGVVVDVKLEGSPFLGPDPTSVPYLSLLLRNSEFRTFEEKIERVNDVDIVRFKHLDLGVVDRYLEFCKASFSRFDTTGLEAPPSGVTPELNVEQVRKGGQAFMSFEGGSLIYHVDVRSTLRLRKGEWSRESALYSPGVYHALVGIEETTEEDRFASDTEEPGSKTVQLGYTLRLRPPVLMSRGALLRCLELSGVARSQTRTDDGTGKKKDTSSPQSRTVVDLLCKENSDIIFEVFGTKLRFTMTNSRDVQLGDMLAVEVHHIPVREAGAVQNVVGMLQQELVFNELLSSCCHGGEPVTEEDSVAKPPTKVRRRGGAGKAPANVFLFEVAVLPSATLQITTLHESIPLLSVTYTVRSLPGGGIDVQSSADGTSGSKFAPARVQSLLSTTRSIPITMYNVFAK